jgi:hypothetical protein
VPPRSRLAMRTGREIEPFPRDGTQAPRQPAERHPLQPPSLPTDPLEHILRKKEWM